MFETFQIFIRNLVTGFAMIGFLFTLWVVKARKDKEKVYEVMGLEKRTLDGIILIVFLLLLANTGGHLLSVLINGLESLINSL